MNREKQIVYKMIEDICPFYKDGMCNSNLPFKPYKCSHNCGYAVIGAVVYGKGYRKASDIARETVEAIKDYEMVFMFTKQKHYKFNLIKENITGKDRIKRTVWSINTKPSQRGHIAPFPTDLVLPCLLPGSNEEDAILDPFMGSGTIAEICIENNRKYIGFELSKEYCKIAEERIREATAQGTLC
jgi:DNA modification methylase